MEPTPKTYVVIDIEATCGGPVRQDTSEIIEIGAVLADDDFKVVDEYCTFVKPVIFPELTRFCTDLTSITQADVDDAPLFEPAMQDFRTWLSDKNSVCFVSWGDYDRKQIRRECNRNGFDYFLPGHHINLKRAFGKTIRASGRNPGLAKAVEIANIPWVGIHHRGIDDARNITNLLPFVLNPGTLRVL